MPVINFKEIPAANSGDGRQDTFELFARDFMHYLGYKVLNGPDRGADGGRDVILEESRAGIGGKTVLRWLMSCKHYAHSGKSVKPEDESDIRDRIEKFNCQGFIGFYSTLPSSGLSSKLDHNTLKAEVQVFDCARIESELLNSPDGAKLASRYFPESMALWTSENPKPALIFTDAPKLHCAHCGKNLLTPDCQSIIVMWFKILNEETRQRHYELVYWCCKGSCDKRLSNNNLPQEFIDTWEDIPDIIIPTVYAKWIITLVDELRRGDTYSETAFAQVSDFMMQVFPHVARHLTSKEKERIKSLSSYPAILGGLG